MDTKKERQAIFTSLLKKVGVKEIAYRLHISQQLAYLWIKDFDDNPEFRKSPVERLDEIIDLAIAKGSYQEVLDLINYYCKKLYGHYTPNEDLLGEVIKNIQSMKNNEVAKNGK